jgi:exopolysaccharide production protein ExoQ
MKPGTLGGRAPPVTFTARPPRASAPGIDKFAIFPVAACAFALIVSPLWIFFNPINEQAMHDAGEARLENRIFWPAMAMIAILLAVQNFFRSGKFTCPPHIICLFAYLSFAGASVLWAFSPESAFVRFVQQVMVVTSIVLPALLATRTADMMRGMYLCFAFALIINLFFVFNGSATIVAYGATLVNIGYEGYFGGKNYLGECAAVALVLSLHEATHRGWRRAFSIVVAVISVTLIFLSDSKTAFGLVIVCPILAQFALVLRKLTRISLAVILLCIPLSYIALSSVSNINMNRISYMLYGDSTLTGRTIIWDFAWYEIGRRPLVGWGYQSFWLVPNSPSVEAPGWVKLMPNAHNGYYDTVLEMGYVGLAFLLSFIISTLHAVGRVADRDPARAWGMLSLILFFIAWNYFESLWMRGFEFLWMVFVIIVAEIGRYCQRFPRRRASYGSGGPTGRSLDAPMPRPRIRLS